ncbi:MAG: DUF4116 domain-containing protein [Clostridia bacterium]
MANILEDEQRERIRSACDEIYSTIKSLIPNIDDAERIFYVINYDRGKVAEISDIAKEMSNATTSEVRKLLSKYSIDEIRQIASEIKSRAEKLVEQNKFYIQNKSKISDLNYQLEKHESQFSRDKKTGTQRVMGYSDRIYRARLQGEINRIVDSKDFLSGMIYIHADAVCKDKIKSYEQRQQQSQQQKVEQKSEEIKQENIEQEKTTEINQEEQIKKDIKIDNIKEIIKEENESEFIPKFNDKNEQIKEALENPEKLKNLSIELQFEILEQNPMLIDHASYDVYYKNADFVNKLIAKEPRILQSSKVGYGITEKHLEEAIEQNPFAIQYVEEYVGQSAYKYVKMAVESNPKCLSVISKHAQISVIRSFSDGEEMLKHASNEVQSIMISRDASYLAYASLDVRNNDEVVRGAVAQNPSMYQYASDRLRDDVEVQRIMVETDFNALDMLSEEQRENPIFAEQKQKWDLVEGFRKDDVKLDDIDKQNFVDINFYNTIVAESKNKVLRQFDSLTQGMEISDKVEEKLQAQVEKKLKQVENKLHRQRNWALFKNGIKTKIDEIKDKFDKGFEAGVVANEIKHMEL